MNKIKVKANANIALIKYWGKRDEELFLPTKSSLSITLPSLSTFTEIELKEPEAKQDEIYINSKLAEGKTKEKIVNFLDLFRRLYNIKNYFKINTKNEFPTGAGLASSASGFAALSLALNEICELNLLKRELSILARQGSGSASRSVYDGFVLWHKGEKDDGSDSYAQQLFDQNHWPEFRVLVAIVDRKQKKISSREAMQITVKTSSSYKKWLIDSEKRIPQMIEAIKNRDFKKVGQLAEVDCLQMHQTMKDSHPSINYLQPDTLKIIEQIKELRKNGTDCYFTIDAGPNVKILCLEKDVDQIKKFALKAEC